MARLSASSATVHRLTARLFAGGWAFLVPYAALHATGLALNLRGGTLKGLFLAVHVLLLALLIHLVTREFRERARPWSLLLRDGGVWFWVLLIAGFMLPGAHLEYPGDPWDHLQRINAWRPSLGIRSHELPLRWAYFWNWTFLSFFEPVMQRPVLAVLSAFWQTLLAWQLNLFARRVGFSKEWARVVVFGGIALLGNNLFPFFRYYALASTPLAYIAYLRGARAILDLVEGQGERGRVIAALLVTSLIAVANHPQELLLLSVFGVTCLVSRTVAACPPRLRARLGLTAIFAFGAVLATAWLVLPWADRLGLNPPVTFYPFMSRFGGFRLWDPDLSYFQTLGLHGTLALFLAILCWRRAPLLAMLTMAPIALLLFPPFAYPFAHATSIRNTYRLLYLLPDSLMLAVGIRSLHPFLPSAWSDATRDRVLRWAAVAAFLGLGIPWASPFFGKLHFQYERPSPTASLTPLDRTAQWFREHRTLSDSCSITSDPITEIALVSFRGTGTYVLRVQGTRWIDGRVYPWVVRGTPDLLRYTETHRVCGFLALDDRPLDLGLKRPLPSWVGNSSRHWTPDAADLFTHYVAGLRLAADGLVDLGWQKTFVPPFYWYYEPPAK
jgi:hypothetical protein